MFLKDILCAESTENIPNWHGRNAYQSLQYASTVRPYCGQNAGELAYTHLADGPLRKFTFFFQPSETPTRLEASRLGNDASPLVLVGRM
jgi:hypothetical protein